MAVVFPATLFDFNGVLVDDEAVHKAAFRDALAPLGVTFTDQAYLERYLGFDDRGAFSAILSDAGHTPTDTQVDALIECKRPLYMRRAEQALEIFPGAAHLLEIAAQLGPVGIVSGALRDEILFALGRMGLANRVAFIVAAEDTRACKPDPEGYHLAVAALTPQLGVRAKQALVIEDSVAGVQAAKLAGLPCLAVGHSYDEAALRAAGADDFAARIADVDSRRLSQLAERLFPSR